MSADDLTSATDVATQAAKEAGPCDDETVVVPPTTEAAPELAWSRDDGLVCDYPAAPWWGKLRRRVTDFFHPYAVEARVAAMDDYDDTLDDDVDGDDDVEPVAIPDASWRAAFAAAAPIVFACAVVLLIGMVALFVASKREEAPRSEAASNNATPTVSTTPAAMPPATVTVAPLPPPTTVTVTVAPHAAPPSPGPSEPAPTLAAAAPDPDQVFRRLVLQIPGMHVVDWGLTEAGARRVCGYLRAGHSRDDAAQQVLENDSTFLPWQASAMVKASTTAYCPQ